MGNTESGQAPPSSSAATPTTGTGTAANVNGGLREEPILLNIYEPAPQNGQQQQMSVPGFGVYHTGLEVYGTEYSFGGGDSSSSGIQPQQPRYMPEGAPWIYKKNRKVGYYSIDTNPNTNTDIKDGQ